MLNWRNLRAKPAFPGTVTPADPVVSFPIPKFWETNYAEPSVQLGLRDCCRWGGTAFDVGANNGALSMLMSRLVGPQGAVLAFEASLRIIDKTHYNLVQGGCANVQLFNRAIYRHSGEMMPIYLGSHLNDSIIDHPTLKAQKADFVVETLALDDLYHETGIRPDVIKIDIEGAEYGALQGAKKLIAECRPVIILEETPKDRRCQEFLASMGYVATDLATYRRIHSPDDFEKDLLIANIIYVHPERQEGSPYLSQLTPEMICVLDENAFHRGSRDISVKKGIELPAGRYVCEALFLAERSDNNVMCGIDGEHAGIMRYHANTSYLAQHYRHWAFHLNAKARVFPYLRYIGGSDPTLRWNGVKIYRYSAFDQSPGRMVF